MGISLDVVSFFTRPRRLRSEKDASWVDTYERLFGSNPLRCPKCKVGILVVTRVLPPMRA